jgi:stearoyl-CoA desaturase (delta-9 desaturase)
MTAERTLSSITADDHKRRGEQTALLVVVGLPFLAVLAAVPMLWGRGISLLDVALAVLFFMLTGHGITVGFHRYFTHGSFKANRGLRIALAIAGSMAIQGPVIRWVADHRRHHAFSDADGDPHSPHRFGAGPKAMLKGLWHAHMGWLFDPEQTSLKRYAPDLLDDPDMVKVHRLFPMYVAVSLVAPAVLGGLLSWSLTGALTAFFWAGLVRVFVLHHTTWSINSLCHTFGTRPYRTRDRSTNFWPLAVIAMGESWHNLHHAEPTAARHGVKRGQVDSSAAFIRMFELLGWATDVRWPAPERLAARAA